MTVSITPGVQLTPITYEQRTEHTTPRAVVAIDGQRYLLKSYTVTKNAHGATDTATITLPIKGGQDWTLALFRDAGGPDIPVYVEIYAGFPSVFAPDSTDISQLTRRFYGILDKYDPKFAGDSVAFTCRSLAAPLTTDKVTTTTGRGMTTVQFVQQCAAQYGLRTNIQLVNAPFNLATVYAKDFIVGIKNLYKWDVLIRSAMFDDVDVWVTDDVLNYASPSLIARTRIPLKYGRDLKELDGSHSVQFNRNIQVQVRTYSSRVKRSVTTRVRTVLGGGIDVSQVVKTITSQPVFGTKDSVTTTTSKDGTSTTHTSGSGGGFSSSTSALSESGKEKYDFFIPNLTPAQCNALAKAMWRQISMHEYSATLSLPVGPALLGKLSITALLELSNVSMDQFATQYWPRQITESFEAGGENSDDAPGWTWSIEVVNHQPPAGAV